MWEIEQPTYYLRGHHPTLTNRRKQDALEICMLGKMSIQRGNKALKMETRGLWIHFPQPEGEHGNSAKLLFSSVMSQRRSTWVRQHCATHSPSLCASSVHLCAYPTTTSTLCSYWLYEAFFLRQIKLISLPTYLKIDWPSFLVSPKKTEVLGKSKQKKQTNKTQMSKSFSI